MPVAQTCVADLAEEEPSRQMVVAVTFTAPTTDDRGCGYEG
jgi:hypothetical protein